ncbi:uncharacterized protein LOC130673558 [Microplitis mediator]|uniref:uncharacterized protein LOC130673558 n=1 Tax=Microplitis mediator TaxID=375433 RepID=UPI002555C567|nr:uncharacterized protein LOC130673558 [Microplitis mediator]
MFRDMPSIVITIKCNTCKQKRQRNVIAPVIYPSNMSQDEIDLSSLENLSMKTPCNTKECKGLTETSISSLGNAIIFEVFNRGTNEKIKLNSLPRSFKNPENMKEIYKLVGAVDFMPPAVNLRSSSDVRLGHFTAVCLRGTQ